MPKYVPALVVLVWLVVGRCGSPTAVGGAAGSCGASKLVEVISIAKFHTCARLRDGGLKCWGINGNGQVGDGTRTHRASPTLVAGLCGVTSVSTGGETTCVSVEHGSVRCWGLGFADAPVEIRGTGAVVRVATSYVVACGVRQIDPGNFNGCAVLDDGTVKCWGDPTSSGGVVGDGTAEMRMTPVDVPM